MSFRRLLLAAALAAIAALVAYEQVARTAAARSLPWHDITSSLRQFETPRAGSHAFRAESAFVDYLAAVMPGQDVRPPPVDYSRDEAFLVTVGPRSSTGYSLRILRVEARRGHVSVLVRERTPGLRSHVRSEVTYPFALITIPRTEKPVYAKFLGRP